MYGPTTAATSSPVASCSIALIGDLRLAGVVLLDEVTLTPFFEVLHGHVDAVGEVLADGRLGAGDGVDEPDLHLGRPAPGEGEASAARAGASIFFMYRSWGWGVWQGKRDQRHLDHKARTKFKISWTTPRVMDPPRRREPNCAAPRRECAHPGSAALVQGRFRETDSTQRANASANVLGVASRDGSR